MTTKELKSYIDRILGNNVRCLLPSYWWKRMFGMTLDKMDADKEELIKKIQSAGSKVTVDSALSTTSTNAVQNKVVTEAINERPTALQMLEFVGNTYEDVNRSVYIGNTEDYHIVNWKETNKTNLTRNVSENEIIHFRIKYILDKYNFITLNPVSIERFPSTTADYATYYECVVCINDAYERWRIYVDGSVEFVGLENIGEASGALQFGQERMVYFENPNTSAKLTDEEKAYNAETYKMVCIDDKPVYLSHFGHWGYQKELTFGDPNGHMIVGFLMGSKDSLQEASVRINADGSAYLIGLVNIADATLDAESERPIQNKAVTLALNEKASIAYVNEKVGNAGGNITVDTEFSETSENPIANKTVAKALSEVADAFEGKQNTIADLDEIRSGAAKGATAIQSVKTINGQSIEGEGNITIEGGGSNITVDTELSDTSENPLQNKVIYENLYGMSEEYIQMYEEQNRVFTNAINNVNTELLKKVDYVDGKQLSTEDFTSALKTKLEGLNNYDDTSIQNAVNSLTTQINTLVSGDASAAIESFNEIIAFLNGVEDSESLDSIIASIEQQIAGKQDKLVSGTNIKTINGESILGEGNIVVNVDTSNLATKEELTSLTNEMIANEEVHAGAYNDLNTRLNELSENVQGETVTKEEFNAAIEGVNNGISAKQDVLVSGTNIKTINNESILGIGNIEINVDTSSLASKEELQNLQNEVIANEEVVAAAFNDVNERINAISENVSGTTVTKEEFESTVETINQTISDNKSATDTTIEGLETSIGNVDAKFANYATTEALTTEITNLTNEIIANEEVHASALNDLNERLNNGGGGSGGSGVVAFYIPSGETATDEEIAKNKAAYDAFIATNGGVYIFVKLAQFTLIPSCFQVDSDLIRIEIMSSVFSEDGSVMSLFFGFASDGSITML